MKLEVLREIIKKKENKNEFAIVTNLATGNSEIFESGKSLSKDFEKFTDQINTFYQSKKNGIIDGTDIFVECYIRPIKVIIVGAVHIAQYLVDFANSLNFEIFIIDPRGYFASKQRFPGMEIINKWPKEAFAEIKTDQNTALIALTHDPKIDDPALQHALKNKFFYIVPNQIPIRITNPTPTCCLNIVNASVALISPRKRQTCWLKNPANPASPP